MPKLTMSLIIPAHNEEKYIGSCLEYALKNGKGFFHEIIVVDNVSTDNTRKVAESYPGVKVVSEAKKGTSAARHRGYVEATGDIIAFIDADTRMPEGWARKIEEKFTHDSKVGVICGPYSFYDLPWYSVFYSWLYYAPVLTYCMSKLFGGVCTGGNFAIRKNVLDKIGGFNKDIVFYGDEADLLNRSKKHTKMQYMLNLKMPTSSRRYKHQGILKTGFMYLSHMVKPSNAPVKDFR